MKIRDRKSLLIAALVILFTMVMPIAAMAQSASDFLNAGAENNIVSDANFIDINSMSVVDIQNFLTSQNSYLATYTDSSETLADATAENGKSAAQIIFDAAHGLYPAAIGTANGITVSAATGTISPKIILVFLQKEQSLVSSSSVSSGQLNAAMGYSCPDSGGCNPAYAGFAMQVGWGAWQLRYNFIAAGLPASWWNSTYGAGNSSTCYAGQTKTLSDYTGSYNLTFANAATAAIYRYTPHVFDSAYNVWKLFNYSYFSNSAPPSTPGVNDTSTVNMDTYNSSVTLTGGKDSTGKTLFNGNVIADVGSSSWQLTFNPAVGNNSLSVIYQDADGNQTATKTITINRHKSGDINGDSKVDLLDLSTLAADWGGNNSRSDFNGDGKVDLLDLSTLAAVWGT